MNIRQWINYLAIKSFLNYQDSALGMYVEKLASGIPFSFARYGDGEWMAMLGRAGANCDGHEYFPALGERLRRAVLNPGSYLYGMQPCAMRTDGRAIRRFLKANSIRIPWHNSDVFHRANVAGTLYPLVAQLRTMPVVMVGPAYLQTVQATLFPFVEFIEVPPKNCFLSIDTLMAQMLRAAAGPQPRVFLFSASMAANVMIHELFGEMGMRHYMLDCGSLWDVYAGVNSRSNYRNEGWDTLIRRNTQPLI
jgi:hypothetical protein